MIFTLFPLERLSTSNHLLNDECLSIGTYLLHFLVQSTGICDNLTAMLCIEFGIPSEKRDWSFSRKKTRDSITKKVPNLEPIFQRFHEWYLHNLECFRNDTCHHFPPYLPDIIPSKREEVYRKAWNGLLHTKANEKDCVEKIERFHHEQENCKEVSNWVMFETITNQGDIGKFEVGDMHEYILQVAYNVLFFVLDVFTCLYKESAQFVNIEKLEKDLREARFVKYLAFCEHLPPMMNKPYWTEYVNSVQ